jgi:hypothetical protein
MCCTSFSADEERQHDRPDLLRRLCSLATGVETATVCAGQLMLTSEADMPVLGSPQSLRGEVTNAGEPRHEVLHHADRPALAVSPLALALTERRRQAVNHAQLITAAT